MSSTQERPVPPRMAATRQATAEAGGGIAESSTRSGVGTAWLHSGQVPGKGRRKRRPQSARQRLAVRTAPDAGHWEVVVETPDQAEVRTRVRRLRKAGVDGPLIRLDTLCGRLALPTTCQLSLLVTAAERKAR
ncbi:MULTISPECIES: hypothetical protein [Streptomyces]|uniref:hypothetical protein n=1 Tax=Streptomyces TaxID=1883 RepID=UPI001E32522E|nr:MULTISPECIES: hypothetical protein [Streptomyces]